MKTHANLYDALCSYENLELAFKKARKRKSFKEYVIEFESDLRENLIQLQFELRTFTYSPRPMETFIVRDPKTRKIGASDFRDRVIHHALINVISPVFEPAFVSDSFANQKGKGTHNAILRFEAFARRVSSNHQIGGGQMPFG